MIINDRQQLEEELSRRSKLVSFSLLVISIKSSIMRNKSRGDSPAHLIILQKTATPTMSFKSCFKLDMAMYNALVALGENKFTCDSQFTLHTFEKLL
jgi:hypothetical protein